MIWLVLIWFPLIIIANFVFLRPRKTPYVPTSKPAEKDRWNWLWAIGIVGIVLFAKLWPFLLLDMP